MSGIVQVNRDNVLQQMCYRAVRDTAASFEPGRTRLVVFRDIAEINTFLAQWTRETSEATLPSPPARVVCVETAALPVPLPRSFDPRRMAVVGVAVAEQDDMSDARLLYWTAYDEPWFRNVVAHVQPLQGSQ